MDSQITILFLAANPQQSQPLQLGEEIRRIREELRKCDLRDRFRLEQEWEVDFADVQGHLLRHRPNVVHFSGHGSKAGEIILHSRGRRSSRRLRDRGGSSEAPGTVRGRALSRLFGLLEKRVQMVVLNACYSETQAQAIAEHVECVVGMRRAINDHLACEFSAGLYRALGYGSSVRAAFELGCNQIGLGEGNLEQESTPQLLAPRGDPANFSLLPDDREIVLASLEAGVKSLEMKDYAGAIRGLRDILRQEQPPGEVYGYLALALQAGRHFNAVPPRDRAEIEELLARASVERPGWSLPWVLLGALELDYYAYHGLVNPRNLSLSSIREALEGCSLSEQDQRLLSSAHLGDEVRCELLTSTRRAKE